MNNVDYTPNSHKFKSEQKETAVEKKVEKVISGTAKRKPDATRKITNLFAPGDMSSIKEYIVMDIVVPAIKKMVSEIIRNGTDMLMYGESGRGKNYNGNSDKVSYRSYYGSNDSSRNSSNSGSRTRSVFDYDNIIIPTRQEAEEVIRRMDEIIEIYQMVSVADLYDLCGVTDHNYMNAKYGWMNIRTAEAVRVRDGYILKLPRAMPLDRN